MTTKKSLVDGPAVFLALFIAVVAAACDENQPAYDCSPGDTLACSGAGNCKGTQYCNSTGTGYGTCQCVGGADAGGVDAGAEASPTEAGGVDAPVGETGSETGADTGSDATADGPEDAAAD